MTAELDLHVGNLLSLRTVISGGCKGPGSRIEGGILLTLMLQSGVVTFFPRNLLYLCESLVLNTILLHQSDSGAVVTRVYQVLR